MFRLEIKTISRKKGQSSVASAAYRSAEKLVDERLGLTFDYTRKEKVEHTEILGFYGTREQLWNAQEEAEKRKDATLAREYQFAFPRELNLDQQKEMASRFGEWLNRQYGVAVDIAIHTDKENNNPHAHILTTTRVSDGYILKDKSWREWSYSKLKKEGKPSPKAEIKTVRKALADLQNEALKEAGELKQVSHLSYKEQGLNRVPGIHLGAAAHAMEKRGIKTEKGNHNRAIAKQNKLNETVEPAKARDYSTDDLRLRQHSYRHRKIIARIDQHNNGPIRTVREHSAFIKIAIIKYLDDGLSQSQHQKVKQNQGKVGNTIDRKRPERQQENRPQSRDTRTQSKTDFSP